MKTLKFHKDLVPLVLNGSKTSTWRLFDDKNLSQGDELELCEFGTNRIFAKARIVSVVEKKFSELTLSDKVGHGKFESDEHMYSTYRQYYKTDVNPETRLKIINFELLRSSWA